MAEIASQSVSQGCRSAETSARKKCNPSKRWAERGVAALASTAMQLQKCQRRLEFYGIRRKRLRECI